VFVGGVVTYALGAKTDLLGVPAELLADPGPVSREVALAMAEGVRRALGAAVGASGSVVQTAVVPGGRGKVRAEATNQAIVALCDVVDSAPLPGTRVG